jgi:exopolysaccharide production protein ExoZ
MTFQAIQALRALAALMVLVFHAHIAVYWAKNLWYIPGISDFGYLGVQLFFCISGFVIAHVVSRPNFKVHSFIWRRLLRIFPLYWIVTGLGLTFWLTSRFFWTEVERLGIGGIVKSFLAFPIKDYPFIAPGWSLEHEVIFYLLAAVIVPIAKLRGLFVTILGLWIIGLYYDGWDYHLFSAEHVYFAAGIAAYWLRGISPWALLPVVIVGLGFGYARLYEVVSISYAQATIGLAVGFSALVAGLVSLESRGLRIARPITKIGDASYSLYLIHWLVMPWIGVAADTFKGSEELWRWSVVPVSIGIALLSHKFIERPLIQLARR